MSLASWEAILLASSAIWALNLDAKLTVGKRCGVTVGPSLAYAHHPKQESYWPGWSSDLKGVA